MVHTKLQAGFCALAETKVFDFPRLSRTETFIFQDIIGGYRRGIRRKKK